MKLISHAHTLFIIAALAAYPERHQLARPAQGAAAPSAIAPY
jgi:hypothetical protein